MNSLTRAAVAPGVSVAGRIRAPLGPHPRRRAGRGSHQHGAAAVRADGAGDPADAPGSAAGADGGGFVGRRAPARPPSAAALRVDSRRAGTAGGPAATVRVLA